MRPVQLPARAKTGKLANIAFRDLTRLAQSFGFVLMRTTGSHRIFRHPRAGTIPLQPDRNGDTKPYRVRQLIALAEEFKLTVEKDAG